MSHTISSNQDSPDSGLNAAVGSAFEFEPNGVEPCEFNWAVRDFATRQDEFDLSPLLDTLYQWQDRFVREFDLQIGQAVIAIELKSRKVLGTYRPRTGMGLTDEIAFNARHLLRPPTAILTTLLHEDLHHWQRLHGTPSRTWYHNTEFTNKAASLGIFVNAKGQSEGCDPNGRFVALLKRYGTDDSPEGQVTFWRECGLGIPTIDGTASLPPAPRGKNLKWRCACTNIRAAVEVQATCQKCNQPFTRQQ